MTHPARQLSFDELYNGLQQAKNNGLVYERFSDDGLSLYTYTQECVYNKVWNEITTLARGLILDVPNRKVVGTPFPKFFNYGE
jgi:RNA ligase